MRSGHSLLFRTLAAVAVSLFVFVTATAFYVYHEEEKKALDRQDDALEDIATALARAEVGVILPRFLTMDPETFQERIESEEPFPKMRRLQRNRRNELVLTTPERRTIIPPGEIVLIRMLNRQGQAFGTIFDRNILSGLSTMNINGVPHRLYVLFMPTGLYTAVAEPVAVREAAAKSAAKTAIKPFLILLPLLMGVIGFMIWYNFKPLQAAAENVKKRKGDDLTPLSAEGLPSEAEPFVEAVNGLLARVDQARTREIRFTADAAHELRSPLTSLMIEAEHLSKLDLPEKAKPIVENLESGLNRSVHQVSQLLQFSRAQVGEKKETQVRDAEPWYFSELTGEILEPLFNIIEEKSIDFGVTGLDEEKAPLTGLAKSSVHAILRNLIENALHYTPSGGRVSLDVLHADDSLTICVSDTGPGIPEEERERVFNPFYRMTGTGVPGTGLGLSIVKTYVDMINAEITLEDASSDTPPGLKVTVKIPLVKC